MKFFLIAVFTTSLALTCADAQGAVGDDALGLHSDGPGWGFRRADKPDPGLPRVLLVGDSVMNSYRAGVARLLGGKANNDLYALGAGNLSLARRDQFHWTAEGARLMAEQVASRIRAALSAGGTGVPGREPKVGEIELHSPDGAVQVTFTLGNDGAPCYRVGYRKAPVLEESRLGFLVKDAAPLTNGFRVVGQ